MQDEEAKTKTPTIDEIDKATNALDALDFTAVAVRRMMGEYFSDGVTNGTFMVMADAIDTLREYVKATES